MVAGDRPPSSTSKEEEEKEEEEETSSFPNSSQFVAQRQISMVVQGPHYFNGSGYLYVCLFCSGFGFLAQSGGVRVVECLFVGFAGDDAFRAVFPRLSAFLGRRGGGRARRRLRQWHVQVEIGSAGDYAIRAVSSRSSLLGSGMHGWVARRVSFVVVRPEMLCIMAGVDHDPVIRRPAKRFRITGKSSAHKREPISGDGLPTPKRWKRLVPQGTGASGIEELVPPFLFPRTEVG